MVAAGFSRRASCPQDTCTNRGEVAVSCWGVISVTISIMPVRPRLFDFVRTDFVSLLLALLVPISLALAAWAALKLPVFEAGRVLEGEPLERMTPQQAIVFATIAGIAAALALLVVTLRLRAARAAFDGILVPGLISKITLFKDRAYVHVHYAYGEREFDSWRFLHQTAAVKALQVGKAVEVALDPKRPQAGWVSELFP